MKTFRILLLLLPLTFCVHAQNSPTSSPLPDGTGRSSDPLRQRFANPPQDEESLQWRLLIAKRRSWSHVTSTDSEGAEKQTTFRCGKSFSYEMCNVQLCNCATTHTC